MIRRGYGISVGLINRKRIDFVCERGEEKVCVQVCHLLYSKKIADRELGVHCALGDNFPKCVVSMDEVDMGRDGIRHMNIRDSLLSGDF